MSKLFPSIIPGSDDDFTDTKYTEREVEGMEYETLRKHAAMHESDAVDGRMGKEELREGLVGLERVSIDE
jgi:hypothetical protein